MMTNTNFAAFADFLVLAAADGFYRSMLALAAHTHRAGTLAFASEIAWVSC